MKRIVAIACTITALALLVPAAMAAQDSSNWFTTFRGETQVGFFLGHDSDLERTRYRSEGRLLVQYAILEITPRSVLWFDLYMATEMGESVAEYLPFSPMTTSYSLSPFWEYSKNGRLYRIGWDHACNHLTYKEGLRPWYNDGVNYIEPDVYYNRIFAAAGSATDPRLRRSAEYWNSEKPELHWCLETGWYVSSVFGLFSSREVQGGNDWAWDITARLSYPVLRANLSTLALNSETVLMIERDDDTYWRQRLELELFRRPSSYGTSAFLGLCLIDEHPRDSREGLCDIGFRVFF
jgi:hypothetical protein